MGFAAGFYPWGQHAVTPNTDYRTMQYNLMHQQAGWGPEELLALGIRTRMENASLAIRSCAPDILLLAERHDEWEGLEALLGPDYSFVQDRITRDGITAFNRTPIAYRTGTFRCVESGFLKLTEEADFLSSNNKRGVTWAILEDITDRPSAGRRVAVFCTHWSAGASLEGYRVRQSGEMRDLINETRQGVYADIPCIVGGDFNSTFGTAAYQSLITGCGLQDADTNPNRIDRISLSGATAGAFACVRVLNVSDHNPVYCDIFIP